MGGQTHWLGDVQPELPERSQSEDSWWQRELSELCSTWFMSQGLDFVVWTVHDLRILKVIQKIFDPWYDDVLIQCSTGFGGSALVAAMAVVAGQGTSWTRADSWLNTHDALICLICYFLICFVLFTCFVHLDVGCCLGNACVMHFGTEKAVVSEHRPGCCWLYDDELLGWTVMCIVHANVEWVFAPCAPLRFGFAVCELRDGIQEIVAGQSRQE